MAEVTQIICDGCGHGKTKTRGEVDAKLVVSWSISENEGESFDAKSLDVHSNEGCARKAFHSISVRA